MNEWRFIAVFVVSNKIFVFLFFVWGTFSRLDMHFTASFIAFMISIWIITIYELNSIEMVIIKIA